MDPFTQPEATDESGQKIDSLPSSVDQQTTDVVTDHGHDESGESSAGPQIDERLGVSRNRGGEGESSIDRHAEIFGPQHADALGLAQRIDQFLAVVRAQSAHNRFRVSWQRG